LKDSLIRYDYVLSQCIIGIAVKFVLEKLHPETFYMFEMLKKRAMLLKNYPSHHWYLEYI